MYRSGLWPNFKSKLKLSEVVPCILLKGCFTENILPSRNVFFQENLCSILYRYIFFYILSHFKFIFAIMHFKPSTSEVMEIIRTRGRVHFLYIFWNVTHLFTNLRQLKYIVMINFFRKFFAWFKRKYLATSKAFWNYDSNAINKNQRWWAMVHYQLKIYCPIIP